MLEIGLHIGVIEPAADEALYVEDTGKDS